MKIKYLKKEPIALVIFAVLIAVFYGNTLNNGFVHDDIGQIVQNEYVHSLKYLPKVVTGCTWEYIFKGCKDSTYYRPFHSLSYLLTWQISSKPWLFHLVNLTYFFIAVSLIFYLIKKLSKNFFLSFFSALFFLIHPVNSETVNWVAAVPELLFAVFVLPATIFFIKYREDKLIKNLIWSGIFYFLAILSKEPAVSLPVIFIFIDWKIFNMNLISFALPEKEASESPASSEEAFLSKDDFDLGIRLNFKQIKAYGIFVLFFVLYLLMRLAVLKTLTGSQPFYFGVFSIEERIYTFISLFGRYLSKLFYPHPLNFFYYFEKKSNFLNPEFIFSFLGIAVFLAAFYLFIKKKFNILTISLLWIFIFIWPVLFFVYSAGENLFSERYLFVPSIGFSLLLAYVLHYFWHKKKSLRLLLTILILLIVFASWYSINPRNKIFKTDEMLYKATISVNPKAHSLRRNLAVELMDEGRIEEAKKEFDFIVQSAPEWWEIDKVYNHLGEYYRIQGDLDKAFLFYQKSIDASQGLNYRPYNNLGALFIQKGEYLKSLIFLCKASQLEPEAEEVNNNFNRVVTMINAVQTPQGLKALYSDVVNGDAFKESNESNLSYFTTTCDNENNCTFIFSYNKTKQEIFFPFLILAVDSSGQVLKINDLSFDPQQRLMGVQVNIEGQDIDKSKAIDFVFPSCNGIYYKAQGLIQQPEVQKPQE